GPRHRYRALLPRPDDRSGLLRRREDGHGPDLGCEAPPLEGRPVQLHVRGIHRSPGRPAGPCRRRPDRRRHADDPQGRSARDEYDVLRALPAHRDQRDQDPGPASRSADRPEGSGPVTAPHARLDDVTDVDPSFPPDAAGPARAADELVALTGGRLVARSDRPIRRAAVDSRLVTPGRLLLALPREGTGGPRHTDDTIPP